MVKYSFVISIPFAPLGDYHDTRAQIGLKCRSYVRTSLYWCHLRLIVDVQRDLLFWFATEFRQYLKHWFTLKSVIDKGLTLVYLFLITTLSLFVQIQNCTKPDKCLLLFCLFFFVCFFCCCCCCFLFCFFCFVFSFALKSDDATKRAENKTSRCKQEQR